MKKITALLLLTLIATFIFGCGKDNDTIDRLEKCIDRTLKRCDEYEEQVAELKTKNYELMATIDALNAQISKQESDNAQSSTSSNSAETSNTNTINYIVDYSQSNSYLAVKFWIDGKKYFDSNTTWYSDYHCSTKVTNTVTIISPIIDKLEISNGYTVYSCMSSNGLVYSSSRPFLKEQ